ncbi:MAG: flagellar filament capping protein FliD [Firmicutes bacterium]|nr:flagellar filament capping protein FliD [Bacillota bacterium]
MASVSSALAASTKTSSGFRVGGLVSGLSTDSIVSQLMDIEKKPITNLENKKTDLTSKLTAWRSFNTRFQAFTTAVDDLTDADNFKGGSATSSNSDLINVSTSGAVVSGSYTVTVKSLAQTNQISSQGYSSSSSSLGTGTFTIKVGSASFEPITLDSTNNSLNGLKEKINSGSYGVTASIINTGGDTPQYKLVLTSNTSGSKGAIEISNTLSGGVSPTFSTIQEGTDAHIVLGKSGTSSSAIDIYSSSNSVTDVVPGVTLDLKGVDTSEEVSITVSQSTKSAKAAINSFIEQFNNLADYFDDQFYYDSATEKTGTLFSDSTLISTKSQLYSMVTSTYGTGSSISDLSKMGITLDKSGKLAITDSDALDKALDDNMSDTVKFFTDSENGFATKLNTFVESANDTTKGIFTTTEDYYNSEIEDIDNQITAKNSYLEKVEARYYEKFSALEAAMAKLKSQGDYLSQQISAMSNSSSSSSSS